MTVVKGNEEKGLKEVELVRCDVALFYSLSICKIPSKAESDVMILFIYVTVRILSEILSVWEEK